MTHSPAILYSVEALFTGRSKPSSAIARAKAALHDALERRRARSQYSQLLECEDHLLRDIGLKREDIVSAILGVR